MAEDDRPLTPEGVSKMEKAARGLRALEVEPKLILSSPLPRARQTAEIVARALPGEIPLKITAALAPGGRRPDLYGELAARSGLESVMLVGHQPSLGEIAGEIAWGAAAHYVELKKGGACALEIEEFRAKPRGTLLWLLTPAILRELA
jgi:phosphohistidine phosphatase